MAEQVEITGLLYFFAVNINCREKHVTCTLKIKRK